MSKICLFIFLLLLTGLVMAQQTGRIIGLVVDENGNSLVGANIQVVGTAIGGSTNLKGAFNLEDVPIGVYSIQATYLGYQTMIQENVSILAGEVTRVYFQLKESSVALEEVVVIGYGTQKKVNLTGAVSTVSARQLEAKPITNAGQALQGQASGTYILQQSGQPGRDYINIRIRGIATLGNNNPLILIDGVPGSFTDLNPNDIESFTVLKDAASSAIYGSRAANGVVLIETRKGKKNRFQIDYHGYNGWQSAYRLPEPISNSAEYMEMYNQALTNEGGKPLFTQDEISQFRNGKDPYLYPNTDWVDLMFNNARMIEHNLRFSGGDDKTDYALSLGYLDQDGVLMGTHANRYSFRLNLNSKVTPWLKVGTRLAGTHRTREESPYGTTGLLRTTFRSLPVHTPYLKNGRYGTTWLQKDQTRVLIEYRHPIVLATEKIMTKEYYRFTGNFFAEWQILPELILNGTLAANRYNSFEPAFFPEIYLYAPRKNPLDKERAYRVQYLRPLRLYNFDRNSLRLTAFSTLTYHKKFMEDIDSRFLLGAQQETYKDRVFGGNIEGFSNNELTELSAGAINSNTSGSIGRLALRSFFGRMNHV